MHYRDPKRGALSCGELEAKISDIIICLGALVHPCCTRWEEKRGSMKEGIYLSGTSPNHMVPD